MVSALVLAAVMMLEVAALAEQRGPHAVAFVSPPPCVRPSINAQPTSPIAVTPPAEALRLGLSGEVFLAVSVDADGAVSDAIVSSWSDPMFIEPALAAARRAHYTPGVIACRPTLSTYTARLEITVPTKRERVDVTSFFPGSWRCGAAHESWIPIFRGVQRNANVREEFVRDSDGSWILKRAGLRVARARPWLDEHWSFAFGEAPPQPGIVQYRVTGHDSFERITASPSDMKTEFCDRQSARGTP
jgi:TonB family protein